MSRARVLVVQPPTTIARDFIDYPYFADLGALQLAAVLDAPVVDAYALPGSTLAWRADGRAHLGAPVDEVLAAVLATVLATVRAEGTAFDAIVVAYTPFHRPPHRCDVLGELLAGLTQLNARIVLADCHQSGQHYVEVPGERVLASYPEAAAYVKYEAELEVPRLLDAFAPGVHRGESPRLDDLPLPAWERIDLEAYFRFHQRVIANLGRGDWAFPIDGRTIPVVTSRGCPFSCAHCSSNPERLPGEPKKQRRPSPERLHAMLRELVQVTGAQRLFVLDELVNVNERHFDAFLAAMRELDLRFELPNGMRADYLFRPHLEAMKGRVTTVSVSAESGSPRVVAEVVKKQLDLRDIVRVAEDARAVGVMLLIHYMIGLPGETREEVNETLTFAMDLWDRFRAFPSLQFATPLPGTPLAAEVERRGRSLPVMVDWGPAFQHGPQREDERAGEIPIAALHALAADVRRRVEASQAPIRLVLALDAACNSRCGFCIVPSLEPAESPSPVPLELLREHHRRGARVLAIDGGEPTLHPSFLAVVRAARAIGYPRVELATNGRMAFYEAYARRLVRSGLTSITFSVHGPDAETHARHVGDPDAFDQAIAGIRNCVREAPAGLALGMTTTVTRLNVGALDELAQLATQLGLRRIELRMLAPTTPGASALGPDLDAALEALRGAVLRWRGEVDVRVSGIPPCLLPGLEDHVARDVARLAGRVVYTANRAAARASLAHHEAPLARIAACATCEHALSCGGIARSLGAGLVSPAALASRSRAGAPATER